jgi:hypothetical protein
MYNTIRCISLMESDSFLVVHDESLFLSTISNQLQGQQQQQQQYERICKCCIEESKACLSLVPDSTHSLPMGALFQSTIISNQLLL